MEVIDADRVHELTDFAGLIAAFETAHRHGMPEKNDRTIYEVPNTDGAADALIILPAWQPQEGILVKLVTSFPNNKARHGTPTVNSTYMFVDGKTGIPQAAIEGEAMIFKKTSCDSALGSKLLSREDAKEFLIIGAGGLAPYLVKAHLTVRPNLKRLKVWNRTRANAEAMSEKLATEGIEIAVMDDLDAAVAEADIITSATMAPTPLLKGALLRPGAHVDLIGSFTPQMREADDDVLRRATIFVDHRQTTERSGEFLGPLERGVITMDDVKADYFELVQGRRSGRQSADEITMLKNGGGSHMDYYAAKYLMDRHLGRTFSTSCSS